MAIGEVWLQGGYVLTAEGGGQGTNGNGVPETGAKEAVGLGHAGQEIHSHSPELARTSLEHREAGVDGGVRVGGRMGKGVPQVVERAARGGPQGYRRRGGRR